MLFVHFAGFLVLVRLFLVRTTVGIFVLTFDIVVVVVVVVGGMACFSWGIELRLCMCAQFVLGYVRG